MEDFPIPFPVLGLIEDTSHTVQPPGSSPSMLNWRPFDTRTLRDAVLAQRAGLDQYNTNALSGANPVRAIASVVKYDDRVTYTMRTSITDGANNGIRWQTALPSGLGGIAIVADGQGNQYTCAATGGGGTGINYIVKTNAAGAIVWKHSVALVQNTHFLRSIRLDIYGDIYVCLGGSGTDGRIYKFRQLPSDAGLVQVWDIHAPMGGMFADICTSGGVVYALENDATYSYLHRIDGGFGADPVLTWTAKVARQSSDTEVAVACAVAQDGGCIVAICDTVSPPAKNGFLRKYGPPKPGTIAITAGNWTDATKTLTQTGKFVGAIVGQTIALTAGTGVVVATYTIATVVSDDAVTLTTDINGGAGDIADSSIVGTSTYDTPVWHYNNQGVGQAIVVRDATLYSCGYGSGTPKYFTKLADAGASVSLTADLGTAEAATIVVNQYKGTTSMDVDALGVVYAAIGNTGSAIVLARIKADFSGADWIVDAATTTSLAVEAYGVACDPNLTDNSTKSERIYVAGTPLATTLYAIHGIDLLTIATADGSPRSQVILAACNGNIVKFAPGAAASSTPTGGSGALSTTARWVQAASAGFNRILFTDGVTYRTYDALADTVSEWKAVGTGTIPPRARLLCVWNKRAVVAGFEDQAQNWAMSEFDNLDGWDFFPVDANQTQAVVGNQSPCGQCPDVITALIPYSDDLMIIGGDHTLWRLTGDPAAGGRFDLITDKIGVAFGKAWAKSPEGELYVFANTGGVYRMVPGSASAPEELGGIADRMGEIDVGLNRIILEWNDREAGLHVFVTPFAGGATTHYFWWRKTGAWFLDQFASASFDPLSVYTIDGDLPADRQLLLGNSDGKVRYWNADADDDDGTAISGYAYIGPLQPAGPGREFKMTNLRAVLSNGSGSCEYAAYAAESPDFNVIGSVVFSGSWTAGRNDAVWERLRGQSVWLKVGRFTAPSAARAAIEQITAGVLPAGMARNR